MFCSRLCVLDSTSYPLFILVHGRFQVCYTWKLAWTDQAWRHATAWRSWAREATWGVQAHPWCGRTRAGPARHRLALVGLWLGLDLFYVGCWPSWRRRWASLYNLGFTLLMVAPFGCFSTVFMYKLCKIMILQFQWKYVNSKTICM
jgi:hypothetical protein